MKRPVVWLLIACFFSSIAQAADGFRPVGVATIDVTPDFPIRLTGYVVRKGLAESALTRLYAKALAIGSDADGPAIIVTVDNCGVGANVVEEVANRLRQKVGITRDHFAVCSSHTHTGPQTIGFAANIFAMTIPAEQQSAIERYTRQLTDKIEQAALAALKDRQPGKLEWAQGKVTFAKNRRTEGGPVDHTFSALRVLGRDGKLRALFANYACHCTTLGGEINQTCGDWVGYADEYIQRDHPGATALIAVGCGADSNPHPRGGADFGIALCKQHGEEIARETNRLLDREKWRPLNGKLACRWQQIELPFQKAFTKEELQKRSTEAGIVGYHAQRYLERLNRGETPPTTLTYPVQSWTFGDRLAMVFLGGEVVVDYSLRLRRDFDSSRLWINAYANDVPCYIPSKRILAEGGYEAESSLWYYDRPAQLSPDIEDLIVKTVREQLPREFLSEQRKADFPPALSPRQAVGALKLKPGFVAELVAAEPLIESPVAIDFGIDGKLWVV
ncbi:MAG TPA: neutral/alkaline non-lysosomal ceramidase N-terminal domain-containing protein, partial [Verrucomicrobiae bacterium]|nr:neutral/alkaline non-lysosomal ceramidase N-terminal domain-containing protein [Verrucomicrobiae bacterium]